LLQLVDFFFPFRIGTVISITTVTPSFSLEINHPPRGAEMVIPLLLPFLSFPFPLPALAQEWKNFCANEACVTLSFFIIVCFLSRA